MFDNIGYAILDKLSKTAFWEWFTKKFLSSATTRVFGYPQFPMEDFFKIVDLLKPNKLYAFVCSDYSSVGSIAMRVLANTNFKFTHGGMIQRGSYMSARVVHMRSTGLQLDHILTLLREVDYFAVIEIPLIDGADYDKAQARIASSWANRTKLNYDFEERLGNDPNKVYCSEYVLNICGDICAIKPRTQTILGREVFAPDNILDIGKVVYSNHKGVLRKYLSDLN